MTRPQTRARTTHVRAFAMEYFPSHAGGDRAAFAGKTLVLPAVGHGNVGQLAVDLMIQTLVVDRLASGKSRLGCLDHPSVLPCVGTDAFAPIGEGRGTTNGGGPVPTPGNDEPAGILIGRAEIRPDLSRHPWNFTATKPRCRAWCFCSNAETS
jgi:hypothetical protein